MLAPGGTVLLPALSSRVDFEGELGLVIGKRVHKLAPDADLRGVIRGYTLADDVSARDLQKKDGQWTRAKGFDTFCPVGPLVSDEIDLDWRRNSRDPHQRRAAPDTVRPSISSFPFPRS